MDSSSTIRQALVNTLMLIVLIAIQGAINISLHTKTRNQVKKLQEPPKEALVETVQYLTPSSFPKLDEEGNVIEGEFVDELKSVWVPVFRGYKGEKNVEVN